jgi:hypothetical protein
MSSNRHGSGAHKLERQNVLTPRVTYNRLTSKEFGDKNSCSFDENFLWGGI